MAISFVLNITLRSALQELREPLAPLCRTHKEPLLTTWLPFFFSYQTISHRLESYICFSTRLISLLPVPVQLQPPPKHTQKNHKSQSNAEQLKPYLHHVGHPLASSGALRQAQTSQLFPLRRMGNAHDERLGR